jgi:hypothetical protein
MAGFLEKLKLFLGGTLKFADDERLHALHGIIFP